MDPLETRIALKCKQIFKQGNPITDIKLSEKSVKMYMYVKKHSPTRQSEDTLQ